MFRSLIVAAILLAASPALAGNPWGSAQWVWDSHSDQTEADNDPRYLRYQLDLAAAPAKAQMVAAADNTFELFVNGHKVGSGSDWGHPQTFDVEAACAGQERDRAGAAKPGWTGRWNLVGRSYHQRPQDDFAGQRPRLVYRLFAEPGKLDLALLLKLADLNRGPGLVPALQALLARPNLPGETAVQAILLLRAVAPQGSGNLGDEAAANFLTAMRSGRIPIRTIDDALLLLQLLPIEGPTDFSLQKLAQYVVERNPLVRENAHAVARGFGKEASTLAGPIWKRLLSPGLRADEKVELITTLAAIESQRDVKRWVELLKSPDPVVARETVRAWRQFKGQSQPTEMLLEQAPQLLKRDRSWERDLVAVFNELQPDATLLAVLGLPEPQRGKAALAKFALDQPASAQSAVEGRQVFARAGCAKCHSLGSDIKIGPPLAGIGRVQTPEYLIESMAYLVSLKVGGPADAKK